MGKKNHELIPSARRLIPSLRDMGYDFPSAVADIVDNSIDAGASRVNIDVRHDGDDSWVRICDDGVGMKPVQIREALRYGASRDYDEQNALGKFGLGLKTASMSQCQQLLVASRSSPDQPQISAYAWDLLHVMETDSWEILEVGRHEYSELLRDPLKEHTGTVVLWRRLDRMLGFNHPYGGMIKKRLAGMCTELEEHLAMVFHRHITGEGGRRKVRIVINGKSLRAWDPFVRTEQGTVRLDPVVLQYDHDGIKGKVILEPYVLPHQNEFSSPTAHAAAAGSLRWNRQQGFYIYRADRMVQSGGWSNLRTLDEHTKLARVAVRFDPRLDEAFRINVAKMRVQIPRALKEQMELAISPVIKMAQAAYRRSQGASAFPSPEGRTMIGEQAGRNRARVVRPINSDKIAVLKVVRRSNDERLWTIQQLQNELEQIATKEERVLLRRLIGRFAAADSESATIDVTAAGTRREQRSGLLREA